MTATYYGRPVVKAPVWKPEVAAYYFTGGLAGASATLAAAARLRGNDPLARSALLAGLAGAAVSPPLLISDLGRPDRFHHMLRVFKPTSPMSVGTWVVSGVGAALGAAAVSEVSGVARPAGRAAEIVAGALGPVLATYTAVLTANTAIPVWNQARRELPFVFAGSAAASAGAAAALLTRPSDAGGARRLAIAGAALELGAVTLMERRLGELGTPYRKGRAGGFARAARALTASGAAVVGLGGRRRLGAAAGGLMLLAGAVCERWSVFRAGFDSAEDPAAVIGPQRRRLDEDGSRRP